MSQLQRPNLLTIEEAARYMNVSKSSLRRWTNAGTLECRRVGLRGERRFSVQDLDQFLTSKPFEQDDPTCASLAPQNHDIVDSVRNLGNGASHVCLCHRNSDEQWSLFRPYVVAHIQRKAPLLFILHDTSRSEFEAQLQAEGFDPTALIAAGLLELPRSSEVYLRGGRFTPEAMIAFLETAVNRLALIGDGTVMLAGEMSWSLSGSPGVDDLMIYEECLNGFATRHPKTTLVCHYSINRFSSERTLEALCRHTVLQLSDRLVSGMQLITPQRGRHRPSD